MSSWFHRLRRNRASAIAIASAAEGLAVAVAEPPSPPPCSPNRASYYVPSRDRAVPRRLAREEDNPKLRDTRFPPRTRSPEPEPGDIVFDVVSRRDGRFSPTPELKLRPILRRPPPSAGGGGGVSSAAASPTGRARLPPRFHTHAAKGDAAAAADQEACTRSQSRRRRRRLRRTSTSTSSSSSGGRLRWVYESVVVVKESSEPEEDFLESMAEMIAANGVRSPRGLEDLLACYLALNAADHHRAIVAAFRRAWLHLHLHLHLHGAPTPTPTPPMGMGRRCTVHELESFAVVV